ncbi:uncharacterized protein [Malus domestica]|uniref:uncharacterized protein n=1 Tax=Malus domestica TaxID=3750 RepID=UPI003976D170
MNNPYVHDFSAFSEDDGVEERPSYGYHIEPTYELPTYGYMAEKYSSPMEHDCRPTNGHQINNDLTDWPTYGYDEGYYSFEDNHIHEYYDRPTNGFEYQKTSNKYIKPIYKMPTHDHSDEELYKEDVGKLEKVSKLHVASIEYGEEMTKCFKKVEESYTTFGETLGKLIDQMCQIPSTKHTHPTTTKEEQIIHVDEGQTMAPPKEKSMKMDMVVEVQAVVGQTPTLGGHEPTPHVEPEEEENSSYNLPRQHKHVVRIEISMRTKLGIKHEWPPPMVPKLHSMANLNGGFDLSTLNFKKRKRFEC